MTCLKEIQKNLKTSFKILHIAWLFFQERNRKVTIYGGDIRINGNPAGSYIQSQQQTPQKTVHSMLKANNKGTRTSSLTTFWYLQSQPHSSHPAPVSPLSTSNKQIPAARVCTSENTLTNGTFTVFTIPVFNCFFEVLQVFCRFDMLW